MSVLIPPSSPSTCVIRPLALSATMATLPVMSSRLAASWEGIDVPGVSRGASLLPVLTDSAGSLIMLTDPSFAIDFSLTGVPALSSSRISIRVGSAAQGLTAVT